MLGQPKSQLSILDGVLFAGKKRSRSDEMLQKIDELVKWNRLVRVVKRAGIYSSSGKGRPSVPILYMLKILFLKHLYNLSDPETEDALVDRLSFRRFVGISFDEDIPDFTTVWRFRERLLQKGLEKKLFEEVTRMLDERGLILRRGTLIDASIIQAARRPVEDTKEAGSNSENKREEERGVKTESSESGEESARSPQKDYDARHTVKGKMVYYGYKAHVGVDYDSRLIRQAEMTTANIHDSQVFDSLVSGDEGAVYADKAYDSAARRERLREMKIECEILEKGRRNHPLSEQQREKNRQRSRIRNQVEMVFAYFKHHLNYRAVRYVNLARNRLQFYFMCIVYNVRRGITLVGQES